MYVQYLAVGKGLSGKQPRHVSSPLFVVLHQIARWALVPAGSPDRSLHHLFRTCGPEKGTAGVRGFLSGLGGTFPLVDGPEPSGWDGEGKWALNLAGRDAKRTQLGRANRPMNLPSPDA